MKVVYWSDYACPYCYIGETNLKKAAKKLGIQDLDLEMKAFELDPTAESVTSGTTVDRLAQKYQISTEQALEKINAISTMASESGIDFDYANANFTNTFNAHRLTKLAEEMGLADELAEKLFKAYFIDHKELADRDVLMSIGKEVGLAEEKIAEVLDSDQFEQIVRLDEEIARQNGINAVPFFIIDEKLAVPGALSTDQMVDVLKQVQEMN